MDTSEILPTITREQFAALEGIAPILRKPILPAGNTHRDALAAFLEDYKKSLHPDGTDTYEAADFSRLMNLLKKQP